MPNLLKWQQFAVSFDGMQEKSGVHMECIFWHSY